MRAPLVICVAVIACQGAKPADDNLVGLVTTPAPDRKPIAPTRAALDPKEFLRALALPHSRVAELIGPHHFRGTSSLEVSDPATGQVVEALAEETVIAIDSDGNYHATLENSRGYGRDAFFLGGTLYLRPRYGIFHKRAPTDATEPGRIRDEIYATVADYTRALQKNLGVKDGGAETVAGRSGKKIALEKGEPQTLAGETRSSRQWREHAEVKQVAGEAVLDSATGVPLKAKMIGTLEFDRGGKKFVMRLEAQHEFSDLGTAAKVVLPQNAEVMSTPERARDSDDRNWLLQGIAPPARRAPTPESVRLESNPS